MFSTLKSTILRRFHHCTNPDVYRAHLTLCHAMRLDNELAASWRDTMGRRILERTGGKLTSDESQAVADELMAHLFVHHRKSEILGL